MSNTKKNYLLNPAAPLKHIFIVRDDGKYVLSEFKKNINPNLLSPAFDTYFLEEYAHFIKELLKIFIEIVLGDNPNYEIHQYQPRVLADSVHSYEKQGKIVSLDPLTKVYPNSLNIHLSRKFTVGGMHQLGVSASPGYEKIETQLRHIKALTKDSSVHFVDDDVFTGKATMQVINLARQQKIHVSHLHVGIQAGDTEIFKKNNIQLTRNVHYTEAELPAITYIDPRDYMIGASGGIVVELKNEITGRSPSFLPFADPFPKKKISLGKKKIFSLRVIKLNQIFFKNIQKITNKLQLDHVDASFANMLKTIYAIDDNAKIDTIIDWLTKNINTLWTHTKALGERQYEENN